MPPKPRTRLLLTLSVPPILIGYGIHKTLKVLEDKYPALPPDTTTSVALRTPRDPSTQHCPHIDVVAARVPLRILEGKARAWKIEHSNNTSSEKIKITNKDLQEVWARTLLGNRVLRAEERAFVFLAREKYSPGDAGDTAAGFSDSETGEKRKLLNGIFTVERAPSSTSSSENGTIITTTTSNKNNTDNCLLVSWKMADPPREFFEKISRYGYPWRLMSGGRHELYVSEPFQDPSTVGKSSEGNEGDSRLVEVRFSSAHDYEVVPEEGGLRDQKVIPDWTERLHRWFGRLVLDQAVKELREGDSK